MKFTDFNFKDYINQTLENIKFEKPTEVQQKLIPIVLSGRDLVGESKTGSGKTHTFLLPIFQKLDKTIDGVQAVITAPSRELATQIYNAAQEFTKFDDSIRISNFVGGTDKNRQIHLLFQLPNCSCQTRLCDVKPLSRLCDCSRRSDGDGIL